MNITDNIKKITSLNWIEEDFGQSKMKADYKRQLLQVIQLDSLGGIVYKKYRISISDSEVMYATESNSKPFKFVSGKTKLKYKGKPQETAEISFSNHFPPFAKLVVDYLLGRLVFYNDRLYDVNDKQAKPLDEFTIFNLYGFKKDNAMVLDILKGIHKHLQVEPIRQLEPYQISGQDFIIDLKEHTLTRTTPNPTASFFKYYDVNFETARQSQKIVDSFLEQVIADQESLHNAKLQTYYMAQVASGLMSKSRFFIAKSGVRTGKGLRHIALSGLFEKIDVELDNLTSKGFDSMNAWALFSGGEMALATEQGDIIGDKVERVLKIIATEKTHVARNIGGNQGMVNLTSVLCIDTNRVVSLSDEMNGRKVLIQYKDRPPEETDLEREAFFEKYWKAFTNQDKSPRIEGCIGFLFSSLEYFQSCDHLFRWADVEVTNKVDLDDFQVFLLDALSQVDFVQKTDNQYITDLQNKTYGNNAKLFGNALQTIGVERKQRRIDGRRTYGYVVGNRKRFDSFELPDETKNLRVPF